MKLFPYIGGFIIGWLVTDLVRLNHFTVPRIEKQMRAVVSNQVVMAEMLRRDLTNQVSVVK